jgi:hypothetical protein
MAERGGMEPPIQASRRQRSQPFSQSKGSGVRASSDERILTRQQQAPTDVLVKRELNGANGLSVFEDLVLAVKGERVGDSRIERFYALI